MRFVAPALAFILAAVTATAEPQYDLLITNGRVVDGSGNSWFRADVAVHDGKIAAIGNITPDQAAQVVDARNNIVAPGFIDVHTHADSDVYNLPLAENFIRDGVTTIVTGNCGGSVRDVGEYFENLTTKGMSLNVATLYGHNTVLRATKGDVARPLTPEEFEEAKALVREAMRDGAIGFSTGLIYKPGTYSETEEIIELQREAAAFGGIYVSHMRSEGPNILAAIDEALRIGRETGSRVQISHFKLPTDVAETIGGSDTTLGKVVKAREEGLEVWLDQYPYTASSTGLSSMLPDWIFEEGSDRAREILLDESQHERILRDMHESHAVSRKRRDLTYAVIASSRAYPEFAGYNIKEIAQVMKLRAQHGEAFDHESLPRDQWPEVTIEDQYRVVMDIQAKGGASCVYHTMAEEDVENIMRHPLVAICSDSGIREFGAGKPHPRGYGSNARVLGRYVRERGNLELEDAIRKMTSLPATAFRMEGRGLLREGYAADIVIFDENKITDKATFEEPHQYSEGFDLVLVNGVAVVANDRVTGAKPGQVVYGPGTAR